RHPVPATGARDGGHDAAGRRSDRAQPRNRPGRSAPARPARQVRLGKNEPGEPITHTAIRELKEETGLSVQPESLRLAHVIHGARGVEAPNGFLTVVFSVHEWSGALTNGEPDKHAQVRWTPTTELPHDFVSTTASTLHRYLAGGPDISLDSWN
ncbi:NUDIX domain-containing protein, partial [Streptosporangium saharense]|uniref:NUDIX domain-containing protein n=1 Tax=Streptosporangium saharense TaxID=1706840 RepID=UPI00331B5886